LLTSKSLLRKSVAKPEQRQGSLLTHILFSGGPLSPTPPNLLPRRFYQKEVRQTGKTKEPGHPVSRISLFSSLCCESFPGRSRRLVPPFETSPIHFVFLLDTCRESLWSSSLRRSEIIARLLLLFFEALFYYITGFVLISLSFSHLSPFFSLGFLNFRNAGGVGLRVEADDFW